METDEQQLAALSPAQRRLVELWLRKEQATVAVEAPANLIPRRTTTGATPLSFAQQRLWFLNRMEPGNPTYNFRIAVHLTGKLDLATLERSLNEIVRRHEALRTTFIEREGQPFQVVTPRLSIPLPFIDLAQLSASESEICVQQLALTEAKQPFDLERGPLLRAHLLHLNAESHVLLLILHHIVSDGWSQGVLLRELAALYSAFLEGKPSPLPELPIQYADYALWQRQWLQGQVLDEQLAYWKRQLEHAPRMLELPIDRPHPPTPTYHGAMYHFHLAATLVAKLRELSRREGVTLFMTTLAAFNVLLHRYTGQTDLVIGSPIAGRNRNEIEGLIGCFSNMLVLHTKLAAKQTFCELLQHVRDVTLGAYTHQDLPFEKLVEAIHPTRNLSRHPLFQVMFALQNAPLPSLKRPGLTITPLEMNSRTSRFEMAVFLRESGQAIEGRIEYSTSIFDDDSIHRLMKHFEMLLESIVAQPQSHLAALPLLSSAERDLILLRWNATHRAYPHDQTIQQLFEAQVARTPDTVALVFERDRETRRHGDTETRRPDNGNQLSPQFSVLSPRFLTYAELNQRANQLAHELRERGVGPEVLVGICTERTADLVVGILAILKAGGAYVPLDPAYPAERLAFMIADARLAVLLTQQHLVAEHVAHGVPTLCLDHDWPRIASQPADNPSSGVSPAHLAYVIYTSGSTGIPKGVAIAHQSTVTLLHWARDAFPAEHLAGVLAATSICFDLSVFELFVPLSWGGAVILADNALQLPKLPAAQAVTLINTVPSAMAELVRAQAVPSSVRTVNLAGEALQLRLVQQIYQLPTIAQVCNLYGPTEDTTYSTWATIPLDSPTSVTIGRPLPNTQVYLLDPHFQPVPIGVAGELYLAGAGLARGYLRRPALTAERFVPNPFAGDTETRRHGDTETGGEHHTQSSVLSPQSSSRLYRTGDLARYRPDGKLEYLGRLDQQVKVRGYRIEPGEIESVLRRHPQVQEALVVARELAATSGDKSLVAYVVADGEREHFTSEIRRLLAEHLPNYMLPSAFVFLNALPRLSNGKVDRAKLPAPEGDRPQLEVKYVAPRSEVEKQIAALLQELLQVAQVGMDDNFFDLGGHSLLLVQLQSKLQALFGHEVPIVQLFRHPTARDLAGYLSQTIEEKPVLTQFEERGQKYRQALQRRPRMQRP